MIDPVQVGQLGFDIVVVVFGAGMAWNRIAMRRANGRNLVESERRAEERGEIRVRLNNLEAMKQIVDKNQSIIMDLARDNQRLTSMFITEFEALKKRVDVLEART